MGRENKYTYEGLSEADLAGFLRNLADGLERPEGDGPTDDRFPVDVRGSQKVKIGIKKQPGGYSVKIKTKYVPTGENGEYHRSETVEGAKPSYKSLKKRMKGDWRAIMAAAEAGRLPDKGVLDAFLADSEMMTTFPGDDMGEEYYDAYNDACRELRAAYKTAEAGIFQDAVAAVDRLKADCHDRFK